MNKSEFKIVVDSSADMINFNETDFCVAPLKIITSQKEYVDDAKLDVKNMVEDLQNYSGKSSTACPSPDDWITAFGDSKYIFCITITSNLSGSYNSACIAKDIYQEKFNDRKVCVIDSLSTGPEMQLIAEKILSEINEGKDFEEICVSSGEYCKHTGLFFMLESMKNLANNGRVSHFAAKAAGLLGMRVVGRASSEGTLEVLEKCRGIKKALPAIVNNMKKSGFAGGKVIINHCFNPESAEKLKALVLENFKTADIRIGECRGLCSFYAEEGGLLVGYEA